MLNSKHQTDKPMRKSSKLIYEISESCGWWDRGMDEFAEWTFEGSLKGV